MGREGGDGWTKQGEHSTKKKSINMKILALEEWDRGGEGKGIVQDTS